MLAERLDEAWRARRSSAQSTAPMRFTNRGLVLGADALLAPATAGLGVSIDSVRLQTLLAAAYRRKPAATALAHVAKAAKRRNEGNLALADMHLALSGLGPLEPSGAQRLFLADQLLLAGLEPDTLIKALDLDGDLPGQGLSKYSPDQPRVPSGSGRASGQWTSSDDAPGPSSDADRSSATAPNAAVASTAEPQPRQAPAQRARPDSEVGSLEPIPIASHPQPTRDQIRAVLYNEFNSLHLTNFWGGPDLLAAETQVGYVLMNRAAHGWPPGHGTAAAAFEPATMQKIQDPTSPEGRAYALVDMAVADMTQFGGDVEDITGGALYYNNRTDDGVTPNKNFGTADHHPPVAIRYGPFTSEGGRFPPYIDIYGDSPLRINPVARHRSPPGATFRPPVTFPIA